METKIHLYCKTLPLQDLQPLILKLPCRDSTYLLTLPSQNVNNLKHNFATIGHFTLLYFTFVNELENKRENVYMTSTLVLVASISDIFTCVNSGNNIIIYGFMDTRFKNMFKTLFCKRCTDEVENIVTTTKA